MELVRRAKFRKPAHRFALARAGLGALLVFMLACAAVGAEPGLQAPLRVGVYQAAAYGGAAVRKETRLALHYSSETLIGDYGWAPRRLGNGCTRRRASIGRNCDSASESRWRQSWAC
jgi:hypothetical protein